MMRKATVKIARQLIRMQVWILYVLAVMWEKPKTADRCRRWLDDSDAQLYPPSELP